MYSVYVKRTTIVIILICVVAVLAGTFTFYSRNNPNVVNEPANVASFSWVFEEDESLNGDGNKQTNLILEITYSDSSLTKKKIDTVPGGCSILPEADKDVATSTTQVQCYYAGLGYKYKIVKGNNSYQVKRQTFEEGSPEYTPQVTQYETVSEFPL